ncbi:MAG: ABC transporter ATP-binding protein [Proteobacteria bacterium]|nr:ABC transporter ATP-binding protein [Pseudomonadota bacterium]
MTEPVIAARGLVKTYGATRAVDGIDLEVMGGEIVGLLGPNGSGKTTTILILLGLTEAEVGEVSVLGFDPLREPLEVKRRVGYLPDAIGFYDGMTARANLRYMGRLAGIAPRELGLRIAAAVDRVGLGAWIDKKVGTFSRGMIQRLGLAEVLVKRPAVVILDEPTAALDPHATHEFLEMIRGIKAEGSTVLLASHHLDQVQIVCDRVALFHRGRVALEGTIGELARRVLGGGYAVAVEADGIDVDTLASVPGVIQATEPAPGSFHLEASHDVRPLVAARIVQSKGQLFKIGMAEPSLNEIYTQYFQGMSHAA